MSSTIKLNSKGIRELLKSKEIAGACQKEAYGVSGRAGSGYVVEKRTYPERTGYAVRAKTDKAKRDNLKHNTLLKALNK